METDHVKLKDGAVEIAQKDFENVVAMSQIFRDSVASFDRKFYDFKLAFAGFLGIVLTIVFANIHYFSVWFPRAILAITILTFATLFVEMWREAASEIPKLDHWENEAVMVANIRNTAAKKSDVRKYIVDATERHTGENKLYQAMKAGKSIDDIIKELGTKRTWKLSLIWWGILFLSVPIIFLVQLFYL